MNPFNSHNGSIIIICTLQRRNRKKSINSPKFECWEIGGHSSNPGRSPALEFGFVMTMLFGLFSGGFKIRFATFTLAPLLINTVTEGKWLNSISFWKKLIHNNYHKELVIKLNVIIYAGQIAIVRTGNGTTDWFQIGKGVRQGCILSPCLFNLYAEYIMRNAGLEEAQAWIKIARRSINNLRYADDTTLMAESEEKLKSLLMNVKKESAYTLRKPEGKKTRVPQCSSQHYL